MENFEEGEINTFFLTIGNLIGLEILEISFTNKNTLTYSDKMS